MTIRQSSGPFHRSDECRRQSATTVRLHLSPANTLVKETRMAKLNVKSEVTGSVWNIEVESGQQVSEGDIVLVIESMKMEIPVIAEKSGTVASILVAQGDAVSEGQTVAVLEF
jgi:acetyl-CoA carboxylase biotin carboxyl carrier protein